MINPSEIDSFLNAMFLIDSRFVGCIIVLFDEIELMVELIEDRTYSRYKIRNDALSISFFRQCFLSCDANGA